MRPEPNEYAEYFERYISRIEGSNILDILQTQLASTVALLKTIDAAKGNFRYAPGKWSVKELIGHVIDTERVFAYRALVFARNDSTSLPGFDQDVWAQYANYQNRHMADITEEFEAVRRATILLFKHLDPAAWLRRGLGNNKEMTTRSAAFVIAGHAQHHREIYRVALSVSFAVIFDMDGLMLDTERPAMIAVKRAGEDIGYPISDDLYLTTLGRNVKDTEAILVESFGPSFSYAALRARYLVHSEKCLAEYGIQVKPGLFELLDLLETYQVRKAVATSTGRERAERRLGSAGILNRFSNLVCGDEIERGKPAPDIFLKAAECLGANPEECYVLEDAAAGIRAAHAAGMMPILIPDILQPAADVVRLATKSFSSLIEAKDYLEIVLKG